MSGRARCDASDVAGRGTGGSVGPEMAGYGLSGAAGEDVACQIVKGRFVVTARAVGAWQVVGGAGSARLVGNGLAREGSQ